MATKVRVWYDPEGDFLEVVFAEKPGYMRETAHDALMERVDEEGNIIGFAIMAVSQFTKDNPLQAELV